jgi:hypothetical protein
MTQQQAFDKMVAHLAEQKIRSTDAFGGCVYRGPDGVKCVVGALLSDDIVEEMLKSPFLSTGIAHAGVWEIFRRELSLEDLGDDDAVHFYAEMQRAHDLSGNAEDLRIRLTAVAKKYELSPEGITSITQWKQ